MIRKLLLAILLLGISLPYSATAADEGANAEIIALEIRNLSTSVDRLTKLLYDQGRQKEQDFVLRKLDIAVAYLNFRSRRIETLERDRQGALGVKTRLEDIIHQWEGRLEQNENRESANAEEASRNDLSTREIQQQLKMLKQRLGRTEGKLLDYDNRLMELHNQLDDVEGFVERNLKL